MYLITCGAGQQDTQSLLRSVEGGWLHDLELYQGIEGTGGWAGLTYAGAAPGALADAPRIEEYLCDIVTDTGAAAEPAVVMMMITFDVPRDCSADFERWYEEEHIPMLMRADGWLRARRFVVTSQSLGARPWTSIACHGLRALSVLDSEERRLARSTPWRARYAKLSWFEAAGRFLYQPASL